MGYSPCASSQPLLLNQKPKHPPKLTMALMDMVLDIEATDMVDTMATDMDMDMLDTVARDLLMLTQLYSMVPMPHTVMDMPLTDTELVTTATHTADTDTIINLLLNKPSTL